MCLLLLGVALFARVLVQVPKVDEGLEAIIFTAQGDMRQVRFVAQ